jgi:hypothetical protein
MREVPEIGDIVLLDWGTGPFEAEVYDMYGSGDALQLRVWVAVHGSSGEVLDRDLLNVPLTWVREVKPARSGSG